MLSFFETLIVNQAKHFGKITIRYSDRITSSYYNKEIKPKDNIIVVLDTVPEETRIKGKFLGLIEIERDVPEKPSIDMYVWLEDENGDERLVSIWGMNDFVVKDEREEELYRRKITELFNPEKM